MTTTIIELGQRSRSVLIAAAFLVLAACGGGQTEKSPGAPMATDAIGAEPTANAPMTGGAPMQLTFTASNPRGKIAAYEWDFKDNTAVASGATVQHTFTEAGNYSVTLTVRDAAGNYNRASTMVAVTAGNAQCTAAQATFYGRLF
jgi:PKD repeat protein